MAIANDLDRYEGFVKTRLDTWYGNNAEWAEMFRNELFLAEELELCVGDLLAKQKTMIRDLSRAFKTWLINKMKRAFDDYGW